MTYNERGDAECFDNGKSGKEVYVGPFRIWWRFCWGMGVYLEKG